MQARFAIAVTQDEAPEAWAAAGWDAVECTIATNPGEPMKPLTEIASGGEMSRVMLALKVAVGRGVVWSGGSGGSGRETEADGAAADAGV